MRTLQIRLVGRSLARRGFSRATLTSLRRTGLLNLSNRTVLVAEDSPDLRAYISSILSKFYNVVQVPDGQAGVDYALAHPPALILVRRAAPSSILKAPLTFNLR